MKSLVFVIDMVNGFCKFGAMADPNIAKIAPAIATQIANAKFVHFICDAHDEKLPNPLHSRDTGSRDNR